MRLHLLIYLIFTTLSACQVSHTPNMAAATSEAGPVSTVPASQIIFLDLEIRRDSLTQESSVKMLNKMVTEGRMKSLAHPNQDTRPGDLQCTFLSAAEQVLYSITIPDPLTNTLEYAAESGELQKKTFYLQQATFTLRAPFYVGTTHLLIEQVQHDNQLKEISRLTL